MRTIMVLDDGETFSPIDGCRIKDAEDIGRTLYRFTGDETGGVALTDELDEQVKEALDNEKRGGAFREDIVKALAALAKACDIESDYDYREEP